MNRGLTIAAASLVVLASMLIACSSTTMNSPRPMVAPMLRCVAGTASSGSLTVTATCNGITSSGHTASITMTATGPGGQFHATSTNQVSVVVTQGASANQFNAKGVAAGTATIHVTDSAGDDVNETETVDDVNESPEPSESPESPEPSESPEPGESESPEPVESESPEPSPTATHT